MKLAEWIINSGISQSELARRLGITQGRVSQLVAGAAPSLELANKIAAVTGQKVRPQDFGDHSMTKQLTLDSVEEAIKAIASGEMVVVVDDDDRENEGDLVVAAELTTPEHIAAIAHAGMDAILVFVKGVDTTPAGYQDFNELCWRAAEYGVDVYAYSYLTSEVHPDDPDAAAYYDRGYRPVFRSCPAFRGVVLVGLGGWCGVVGGVIVVVSVRGALRQPRKG